MTTLQQLLDSPWPATERERAERIKKIIDLQPPPLDENGRLDYARQPFQPQPLQPRPTVSVIVTARNYGRFLRDCLSSCLNQSVPIELIYSDDASSDDSLDVARSMKHVTVVASRVHSGAPEARNRGARFANGEVYCFVDGDDQLPHDFIERKLNALTRNNSFAYGDVQQFGLAAAFCKNPQWADRKALWHDNICETASAMWAKLFWRVGGWRESPGNCWDWDLWLRLSQIADPVHSGSVLLYRVHGKNDSHTLGYASPGMDINRIRAGIQDRLLGACVGAAVRSPAKVRVGFLFKSLEMGGAQRWLVSLHRERPTGIVWSGVVLTDGHADDYMAKQVTEHVLVASDERIQSPLITKAKDIKQAARAVCAESDVMVCWCHGDIAEWLGDFPGKVVLVSHGACEWTDEMFKGQLERATHIAAVSQAAALIKSKRPVKVILNGAELNRCKVTRKRSAIRKDFGLKENEIAVGHVGRFSWDKNPLAIANAVALLGRPYRAVYVGTGWRKMDVIEGAKNIIADPIFVPDTDKIGDAFSAIDCFVLATPSEGSSLSILEAWICGTPVVATRVGAVPEIEAEFGPLVVPVAIRPSAAELAKAIKLAISERNRGRVERAKAVAREHFTSKAMADGWGVWLKEICRA